MDKKKTSIKNLDNQKGDLKKSKKYERIGKYIKNDWICINKNKSVREVKKASSEIFVNLKKEILAVKKELD